MIEIPLTQNKIALISIEDLERVCEKSWHYDATTGYARCSDTTKVYLHRFIVNASNNVEIDHRNGNKLDCQKDNLREATVSQNAMNRKVKKTNPTGYKGVSFCTDKRYRKNFYRARIQHPETKKYLSLGSYNTSKEAALAYNKAALELYGEFAKLNEVSEVSRKC